MADYIEEVKAYAESRGGVCLSESCVRTKDRVEFQCAEGHAWVASWYRVRRHKGWCRKCPGKGRKTMKDVQVLADKNNWECLSTVYKDSQTHLQWKCHCGHEFKSCYSNVARGRGCASCSGNIKHTLEYAQQVAEDRGGKCLSVEYHNLFTYMDWECSNSHRWSATFNNIRNNKKWCLQCFRDASPKYSIQDAHDVAASNGGKCLSTEYRVTRDKLSWECVKGHRWISSFASICIDDNWCTECTYNRQRPVRKSMKDVCALADKNNWECLSLEYKSSGDNLRWRCHCGYEFGATYSNVSRSPGVFSASGRKCASCLGTIAHTLEYVQQVAKDKGGKCLSSEYKNLETCMNWECGVGHRWSTTFGCVNSKSWCPTCFRIAQIKYTIQDAHDAAAKHGGKCLSTTYRLVSDKLEWECAQGHRWVAGFSNVCTAGYWCALCKLKTQAKLSDIIHDLFPSRNIINNCRKFDWLSNEAGNGKQELDIYVEGIKLAIEYDGEGHFKPIRFGGCSDESARIGYENTIRRDAIKNKKVAAHPEDVHYFIRIKYTEKLVKENIIGILKAHGVPLGGL